MSDSVHKTGTQPSEWAQTKLAEWERNMAKVKEEHPEFNIDPENKWWIPLVELEERTNSLNEETREKYHSWSVKYHEAKYDPEKVPALREEMKTILAGYPEVEEIVEKVFFNEKALTAGRRHVVTEMEAGREPFAMSCAK
ncbi:hypothetical protein BJX68DRAFT_8268 [Aspergillus pseudodeflectus]|uniref:Uncharacterized protein n=1 Tax=Aspergillus pseudodeflectus TaxID=176178 RepID=A0ABR4LAL9_9EURO